MLRKIVFARPKGTAAISVTGPACELGCAHCGAKYLKGMRPPEEAVAAFSDSSFTSFLISGGSDAFGRVPISGWPWKVKSARPDARLNVHTGVLGENNPEKLLEQADVVSFDYVSDERIVERVYGSLTPASGYVTSFIAASNSAPTVPHITAGLLGPEEEPGLSVRSLEEIRGLADKGEIPCPPGIVIIVFRPTPGTMMQDVPPPEPYAVAEVIRRAKMLFPRIPVSLGCMRPSGQYREVLDPLCMEAGADVIVMPSKSTRRMAAELGMAVTETCECCAFEALKDGDGDDVR